MLHVLTHSFPTRRSSALPPARRRRAVELTQVTAAGGEIGPIFGAQLVHHAPFQPPQPCECRPQQRRAMPAACALVALRPAANAALGPRNAPGRADRTQRPTFCPTGVACPQPGTAPV